MSEGTQKGKHTTVSRKLVKLNIGGYVADTPGLKALDLWDITPEEVDGYFREISRTLKHCRFSDCTHTHEPGCAVIDAVKRKRIHPERYISYLRMREVEEETGLLVQDQLVDCGYRSRFEILPAWRSRYAPGVAWNTEHVFRVELGEIIPITLNGLEHLRVEWLPARQAADRVSSHTNRAAIERYVGS